MHTYTDIMRRVQLQVNNANTMPTAASAAAKQPTFMQRMQPSGR